jgi:alanine racemase
MAQVDVAGIMAATEVPARRAVARVDLGAIERNCAALAARLGGAALCAVVKADGYGHGAAACARAAQAGGARWLAVATTDEAVALRADGVQGRILCMGALTSDELEPALRADADLVAWTFPFLEAAAARAMSIGAPARLHVKLDTGMGRLGTKDPGEARELVDAVAGDDALSLAGFMTHFATADEPDSDFFGDQLRRFTAVAREVKEAHPECILHAANSAAALRDDGSHFDMARCGIAVYGLDPFHEHPSRRGLVPALRLESYVADVKRFAAGETAGYGRAWTASSDTCVAVLPIGYGDGYRRGLSNAGEVLVRGRRFPIVGTVSMDNITVELGNPADVQPGDVATLIGTDGVEEILAEDLALALGTINYEVTCGLSARVVRVHHGGGSTAGS